MFHFVLSIHNQFLNFLRGNCQSFGQGVLISRELKWFLIEKYL